MPALLPEIDPLLEARLRAVAHPRREALLHRLSAGSWTVVALAAAAVLGVRWISGFSVPFAFPVLAVLMGLAVFWNWRKSRTIPLNLNEAARALEARHPELQLALQTAFEQRAESGKFSFLQRRVIRQALEHADREDWEYRDPAFSRWKVLHLAAMSAAFALLIGVVISEKRAPGRRVRLPLTATLGVTVTPGNAEVERRSIVVITTRFGGAVPRNVHLLWQAADGEAHTDVMAKSLSDPIFAFTLPPLQKDTTYQISYDGRTTTSFKLTAFDFPALVRADASLTYPEYTGFAPRTIAETRRVSAVEGTALSYAFSMNKPLRRAVLRDSDGSEVELTASNAERTHFTAAFRIEKSRRFTLRLEDDQGRANRVPEEIRIEALLNQRPQLRWIAPTGDPRVSPIEEVRLQAEARDDFGLLDQGIAISLGEAEPEFISLKGDVVRPVEAKFEHRLALETRKVEPGQLVTWFAWADDFGPDGKTRRTSGDLHFADVRPLDEIFREDQGGGGDSQSQQQGGGGENQELIELQRQISIALWKLKESDSPPEKRKADLDTLQQSQSHVRQRLQASAAELEEPRQRAAAEKAKNFMDRTLERLKEASRDSGPAALTGAWTGAQGAYQELLKMQPKETRVGQANQRNGQSGRDGNQRQLNQLEFKQSENRYETETEAQPMTTPQEREQLQALSKLRELARRQQEVNQRLQELQTALTAAADEEQREQVRRELKRLEEEQRRLLADTDELRDRMDRLPPGAQSQQAREQLDRTREDMRRSSERLEKGEVSPALAEGARAAEELENLRENFRRESSSQFSEQMREARREAREMGEKQRAAEKKLSDLSQGTARSLDDSESREEIARTLEEQRAAREKLLNTLRNVAEEAETSEPGLNRRLYDLLRQQGQTQTAEQLQAGAEMLRRGFVPQAEEAVTQAGKDLQQLQNGIERAADSILGDEAAELRYAQRELDELSKELQRERPESENPGQAGQGAEASGEQTERDGSGSAVAGAGDPGDRKGLSRSGQPGESGEDSERTPLTAGNDSRSPGSATPATTEGDPRSGRSEGGRGRAERGPGSEKSGQPGASGEQTEQDGSGSAVAGGGDPGNRKGPSKSGQPGESGEDSEQTLQTAGNDPRASESAPPAPAEGEGGGERQGGSLATGRNGRPGQRRGGASGGGGGERSGGERGSGSGMESLIEELSQQAGGGERSRPLTGEGFNDWFERLRTVEELTQLPEARQGLAGAREQAETLRRDFKRHSKEPKWSVVESGIAAPLAAARVLLRQELARRENPQALQPVDRDPVPENYAESVRKYYEALGR